MGWCVELIPQNGFCIIQAIKMCVEKDLSTSMTLKNIARKIFREVKDRVNFYSEFLPNYTPNEIIRNVEKYLKQTEICYTMEVVDIIIGAAANALNVNIKIIQNSQGFKNVLEFQPTMRPSISTIFLMLERDAQPEKRPK